jgi:signal transduction histidine kinase
MLRLTRQRKILLVFLGLALVPLGLLAVYSYTTLATFSSPLSTPIADATFQKAFARFSVHLILLFVGSALVVFYGGYRLARCMSASCDRLACELDECEARLLRTERLVFLDRSVAGIAHEVRNPLTGITLLLDELHDRLAAQTYDRDLVRRALEEIERLGALTNGLLHLADEPQEPKVAGDVTSLLRDLLFLLEKQCRKGGVELTTDLPTTLPLIGMDPAKLKQAFLNLLTNALEAMPRGGHLRVVAAAVADGVEVTIADSGVGMSAERLPRIFEPFVTGKGEGSGLGLAITRSIVSDHSGQIEVKSRVGAGTTFILRFPDAQLG